MSIQAPPSVKRAHFLAEEPRLLKPGDPQYLAKDDGSPLFPRYWTELSPTVIDAYHVLTAQLGDLERQAEFMAVLGVEYDERRDYRFLRNVHPRSLVTERSDLQQWMEERLSQPFANQDCYLFDRQGVLRGTALGILSYESDIVDSFPLPCEEGRGPMQNYLHFERQNAPELANMLLYFQVEAALSRSLQHLHHHYALYKGDGKNNVRIHQGQASSLTL